MAVVGQEDKLGRLNNPVLDKEGCGRMWDGGRIKDVGWCMISRMVVAKHLQVLS